MPAHFSYISRVLGFKRGPISLRYQGDTALLTVSLGQKYLATTSIDVKILAEQVS